MRNSYGYFQVFRCFSVVLEIFLSSKPPIRDCAIITWRGAGWEMVKYGSKLSRTHPLTKQKFISSPPPTDNIKVNPPPLLPPPTCSLLPNLRVGCLPQTQIGSPIDNEYCEYDPLIYGVQQVEGIDYETLSLFTSATDKACLRDPF